jgi:hypothetical protein
MATVLCHDATMKAKPSTTTMEEGKVALDHFTRTMKALFRVPKSAVQDSRKPTARKKTSKPHA